MIDVEARIGVSEAAGEDRAIELEDLVRELAATSSSTLTFTPSTVVKDLTPLCILSWLFHMHCVIQ